MLPHTKFFTFSGYTKGLAVARKIPDKQSNTFELELPSALQKIFQNKYNKHLLNEDKPYITIDGVMMKVNNLTESLNNQLISDKFYLSVEANDDSLEHSALHYIQTGQEVSVGLPALKAERFLVKNYPVEKARLIEFNDSFEAHGAKLTFLTSQDFADQYIKTGYWVGINGSSLTVNEVKKLEGCTKFSVQIKSERTRELTLLGSAEALDNIKEVNLTPGVENDQVKVSDFKSDAPFNPKKFGL